MHTAEAVAKTLSKSQNQSEVKDLAFFETSKITTTITIMVVTIPIKPSKDAKIFLNVATTDKTSLTNTSNNKLLV